jgi:predicted transcriptional regulator with HTH domain
MWLLYFDEESKSFPRTSGLGCGMPDGVAESIEGNGSNMKNSILSVLLAAVFLFPGTGFAGQSVTAKGLSFFEPGREVVAREKALDEAKRAAIETAMGTTIESRTVVENFEVVKDQIFSRASGYLKNIEIIDEKKSDLGTYEIEIKADVEVSVLVDDLDRFQNMIKWQKNPRVRIGFEEGMAKDVLPAATKTANLLTERLKQNGFKVFRTTGDADVQVGFLVALSLEMASRTSTFQGLDLTLNEVSLTANIYRPGDGEILGASSAVQSAPGENRLQVLDKGARACVDAIWKDLRAKLLRLWEKELYSERDLYLVIENLPSHAQANEILPVFQSDVSGVVGAKLVAFKGTTGEYNLRYRGWAEQFLNEIQMSYFKNKYFDSDLVTISGNKIVLKLK